MISVSPDTIQDAINIANGVYAPLTGFLYEDDFHSVLNEMRLSNGKIWSLPIVVDVNEGQYNELKNEKEVFISDGIRVVKLSNIQFYSYNKEEYAEKVFGTSDDAHPGVREIFEKEQYLLGGLVDIINEGDKMFSEYNFSPREVKRYFQKMGWDTIVAFQTRNVPHRSHEYIQRKALEGVDGLFVQPVIGKKKQGDFRDEVIINCYQALFDAYYPKDKCFLGVLPIRMHYAGPREAVIHAIIRRNYGCTHMIIGRDHAGVGNFYEPYAAQKIFNKFDSDDLGIDVYKFNNVNYCKKCGGHTFDNLCTHDEKHIVTLSGTKIRDMVRDKQKLPKELIRPEISDLILKYEDPFV